MASIVLRSHVGSDGILKVEVPESMREKDVTVVLSVEELTGPAVERDARGWPIGYFERVYGSLKDMDFERPPQPPMDPIDPLEEIE